MFVVYRGVNESQALSMDVRVNPLIWLVWVGFGLLMLGTLIAMLGRRNDSSEHGAPVVADGAASGDNEAEAC